MSAEDDYAVSEQSTASVSNIPSMDSIRQSEERRKEIEEEVKKTQLTSELRPLHELKAQYQDGNFLAGLEWLEQVYGQIRIVRGDGNCYYRAFLFSLAENVFHSGNYNNNEEARRILEFVKKTSWENVKKAGYDEMTIEIFYEELVNLLEKLGTMDPDALYKEMNQENSTSDYCTWYLRVVTATHLRLDADRFLPFLEHHVDIIQFCQKEVEPMGKDCEQLQVLALAEAFGVQVKIEYLDGHDLLDGKLASHVFGPESASTKLVFLYRPGHYDILYPK